MSETSLIDRIRDAGPKLDDSDWSDVVARAGLTPPEPDPRPIRRRPRRLFAVAFVAAAIAAVVALGPWGGTDDRLSVLDRALAAVSGGPVLHAVLRVDTEKLLISPDGPARFSVIDLSSGHERTVESRIEFWYDPERKLLHQIMSIDGAVQLESLQSPTETRNSIGRRESNGAAPTIDPALGAFFKGYRQALQDGSATLGGTDVIDGRPVQWLRFDVPGSDIAHEIALDASSDQALFLRTICPRCTETPPTFRIETLEGVAADAANFTPPIERARRSKGRYASGWRRTIDLSEATSRLGRTALWAGPVVDGIDFSLVQYLRGSRHTGLPTTKKNRVGRGHGLSLVYGADLRPKGRYRIRPGQPYVGITETFDFRFGPGNFDNRQAGRPLTIAGAPVPPEGQVALSGIGSRWWTGQLRTHGLYVEIYATSRSLVLAAARALEPVPASG